MGIQPRIGQIIDPEDIEVLIVHRPRYNDWSWPKGKAENGELLAAAAVREVEEETGEVIRLCVPLTVQRYRLGSGHIKEVHYWVGRQAAGTAASRVRPPVVRAPQKEIDDCRWVSAADAQRMLTRRGDRRLLTEVTTLARTGFLVTEPLLMIRPALTVERERWEGVLAERHLTRVGVRQSLDIIDTLSAFGVQSIHSSEWVSACRTVAPYASVVGLPIQCHPELTEPATLSQPEAAADFLCTVIAQTQAPTLVAAHRASLPIMVDALRRHAGTDVRPSFPTEEPLLRPAELLVAHIGAGLPRTGDESETHVVSVSRPAPPAVRRPVPKPGPHIVAGASRTPEPEPQPVKVCTGPRQIVAVERHAVPGIGSAALTAQNPSVAE